MARDENPPFERGTTLANGGTIDSSNLPGVNIVGMEWVFEDLDYSSASLKTPRTNRRVKCRAVRNVAAAALLPKRLVTFQKTAGESYGQRVDGYSRVTADRVAGVVDEWLPSAGVPVNDVFWLVIEGPSTVLSDLAGADNDVWNVGDVATALTAATSGATTAGRPKPQDLTGATSLLGNEVQNAIGRAMSAKTTANTNADLLMDICRRW